MEFLSTTKEELQRKIESSGKREEDESVHGQSGEDWIVTGNV